MGMPMHARMRARLEARLVQLAHRIGLERAEALLSLWQGEELAQRHGVTRADQLDPESKVVPLLSPGERQLVLGYLKHMAEVGDVCRMSR